MQTSKGWSAFEVNMVSHGAGETEVGKSFRRANKAADCHGSNCV